ncbi:MAG: sigma-70 family RNA polymerase sigma factor [Firmicutes bacterium]|nr:sigma-70 family RNA polymerase sigma factor [Bacillota bacterium]
MQHIYPSRSKLLRFCAKLTRDSFEAAETADAALCKAWEKLEQLSDPRYAESWLFSIAKNLAYDLRRHPFEALPPEELLPSARSTEERVLEREAMQKLAELLKELTPEQRQAVYFCRVLGRDPSELAELLQVSSHTVSARLYRGLRTLRKKWQGLQ